MGLAVILTLNFVLSGELRWQLDEQLAVINSSDLIIIKRSTEQLGLIKARLWGIREARGPVVLCMDSHMEVQERW